MNTNVPVARRNILADRRRLAISTLGVGLAVALILLLEGLWGGVLAGISADPVRVGRDPREHATPQSFEEQDQGYGEPDPQRADGQAASIGEDVSPRDRNVGVHRDHLPSLLYLGTV